MFSNRHQREMFLHASMIRRSCLSPRACRDSGRIFLKSSFSGHGTNVGKILLSRIEGDHAGKGFLQEGATDGFRVVSDV